MQMHDTIITWVFPISQHIEDAISKQNLVKKYYIFNDILLTIEYKNV